MNQEFLEGVGLTASEAKVYLMLLERGASLAGFISRETGIHRRSVYDAIERLVQKGLVSYIKQNNRKYFKATNPERLIEILKEKEEDVRTIMPELKLLEKMSEGKNETLFFRGRTALQTVFDDQIEKGEEILVFGTTLKSAEFMKYYFPHYDRKRVQKKIKVKMILNESERKLFNKLKPKLTEVRFVPKDIISQAATNVYGRNVAIVSWRLEKNDPVALIIRQDEISESYRNYFNFIWRNAKK